MLGAGQCCAYYRTYIFSNWKTTKMILSYIGCYKSCLNVKSLTIVFKVIFITPSQAIHPVSPPNVVIVLQLYVTPKICVHESIPIPETKITPEMLVVVKIFQQWCLIAVNSVKKAKIPRSTKAQNNLVYNCLMKCLLP